MFTSTQRHWKEVGPYAWNESGQTWIDHPNGQLQAALFGVRSDGLKCFTLVTAPANASAVQKQYILDAARPKLDSFLNCKCYIARGVHVMCSLHREGTDQTSRRYRMRLLFRILWLGITFRKWQPRLQQA